MAEVLKKKAALRCSTKENGAPFVTTAGMGGTLVLFATNLASQVREKLFKVLDLEAAEFGWIE